MKNFKLYLLFFSIAFVLRVVWIFITGSHIHPQTWEYEEAAVNLLNGRGFTFLHLGVPYFAPFPPLYTFFCAGVYFITKHSFLILELFQAAISAFICVIIFRIADSIFSRSAAILSAILAAFHPGIIIYTAKLHPLVMDTFFISLTVLAFLKLRSDFSIKNQIAAGVISGLCMLTRSTIVLFLFFAIIWFFYQKAYPKRKAIFGCFVVLFVSFLVILPWTIRNYVIHRQLIFIQAPAGELFWRGNNINASGSSYKADGRTILESASPEFLKKLHGLDDMGQNKLFKKEAFNFIKIHPFKAVGLFIKKSYYFWWFSPQSGIEYPKAYLSIYKILYSGILLFAISGIIFSLSSKINNIRCGAWLIVLLFISISFAQSIFYVEGRHRWAIEPLLLIFTAHGLIEIKDKLKIVFLTKNPKLFGGEQWKKT